MLTSKGAAHVISEVNRSSLAEHRREQTHDSEPHRLDAGMLAFFVIRAVRRATPSPLIELLSEPRSGQPRGLSCPADRAADTVKRIRSSSARREVNDDRYLNDGRRRLSSSLSFFRAEACMVVVEFTRAPPSSRLRPVNADRKLSSLTPVRRAPRLCQAGCSPNRPCSRVQRPDNTKRGEQSRFPVSMCTQYPNGFEKNLSLEKNFPPRRARIEPAPYQRLKET